MRIIRISLLVTLLLGSFMAPRAMAAETSPSETKIDLQNNGSWSLSEGMTLDSDQPLVDIPYNLLGFNALPMTDEQIRDAVLARFKNKFPQKGLPEGQFLINASAYTAAADECGKSDGITASGLKVKINRTIACSAQFPLGTKIKIAGYGTFVCEDRGGAIKGNRIDIYMETKQEAFAFGRRILLAEVIK